MPYSSEVIGIYKIANVVTNKCYVGQSQRCKKRIADHFNLLSRNRHPNAKLQYAYNKYGKSSFVAEIEIECEDTFELDDLESAFLLGNASFEQISYYNIATDPFIPMRGRHHTDETKERISRSKKDNPLHYTPGIKDRLSKAQIARRFSVPGYVDKIKAIVRKRNAGVTFTALAKEFGYTDASSVCVLYHRYKDVKDF